MEREKEWVGNRERGRGTERESQKPRGVEKVREQSDRRTEADRASFSDAQRAAPTSTLYAPPHRAARDPMGKSCPEAQASFCLSIHFCPSP